MTTIFTQHITVLLSERTVAALNNLCNMLGINEKMSWDYKVFELARRAFMAKAQVDKQNEERRLHPMKARAQLMVKKDTEAALLSLYENMYPFQDFVGWNKFLAQLVEVVHDNWGSLVLREEVKGADKAE